MNSITNNSISNNKVNKLDFTEDGINLRLAAIKDDFLGDLKEETLMFVKKLLEKGMDIEIKNMIGAKSWEHIDNRNKSYYRNGFYNRSLWTTYGWIDSLTVPRLRSGGMNYKTFDRYKRRSDEVNKHILEMFLAGVSTRHVKEVLKPIYGPDMISAATVSEISKQLDMEVARYHDTALKDEHVYLMFDGIYLKVKSPIRSMRRCILVAYGIKTDGTRELIDYRLAREGESQVAWESFLTSLYNRGLKGGNLKLVVMDGNKGLLNAIDLVWPDVKIQRCWAHKLRNVTNRLPMRLREACSNQAREIYDAGSKSEAIKAFKKWAKGWRVISAEAVECLENDLEYLLNFYECPECMWKKLRTTNIIERCFREVRRRTRPMSCFTNRQSVERIIFAIFNR